MPPSFLSVASAHTSAVRLHLPLSEEVADGGVLCRQGAGEEGHQAPEPLPQLLHVLLQAVDVCVQLPPAALHLWQDVIHQALHLQWERHPRWRWTSRWFRAGETEMAQGNIRCYTAQIMTGWGMDRCFHLPLSPCRNPQVCYSGLPESFYPSSLGAACRQSANYVFVHYNSSAWSVFCTFYMLKDIRILKEAGQFSIRPSLPQYAFMSPLNLFQIAVLVGITLILH